MVVLLLSALLQSRVTPRDRLHQPLSPLCIVFHLPSLLRCFPSSSLLHSCSPSIKQYKLFVIFFTLLNLGIPLALLAHSDSGYISNSLSIVYHSAIHNFPAFLNQAWRIYVTYWPAIRRPTWPLVNAGHLYQGQGNQEFGDSGGLFPLNRDRLVSLLKSDRTVHRMWAID